MGHSVIYMRRQGSRDLWTRHVLQDDRTLCGLRYSLLRSTRIEKSGAGECQRCQKLLSNQMRPAA
jgi:hypothetical protein